MNTPLNPEGPFSPQQTPSILTNPLKWVTVMLGSLSKKLPQWAQIVTFFILLLFMIAATIVMIAKMLPKDEFMVHGFVEPADKIMFIQNNLSYRFSGDDLYTNKNYLLKDNTVVEYRIDWIWRIPKSKLNETLVLGIDDGGARSLSFRTIPANWLIPKEIVIKVDSLLFRVYAQTKYSWLTKVSYKLTWWRDLPRLINPERYSKTPEFVRAMFPFGGQQDTGEMSSDTLVNLSSAEIARLVEEYNNTNEIFIRTITWNQIARSDTNTAKLLADSLIAALNTGDTTNVGTYASFLSVHSYVYSFFKIGPNSDIFNVDVQESLIDLMSSDIGGTSKSIQSFFENLGDPRTVPILLKDLSYTEGSSTVPYLRSLAILENPWYRSDTLLVKAIRTKLLEESKKHYPEDLQSEIDIVLQRLP